MCKEQLGKKSTMPVQCSTVRDGAGIKYKLTDVMVYF
jgi:hypothetical protein